MNDSLGDRMKMYEHAFRYALPRRMPLIVRVDGKAFHSWTRGCERPFDAALMTRMDAVAVALCTETQGAALAYIQSDEVSVLVHNYRRHASAPWLDNEIQKIASISASVAASTMTVVASRSANFDARVFVVPEADVCNYFVWRQQDATRNSVQMVAHSLYSAKELHKKCNAEMQDMIHEKGQNWNDLPPRLKRGRCAVRETFPVGDAIRYRWVIDNEIPIFTQAREYVERHLAVESEAA